MDREPSGEVLRPAMPSPAGEAATPERRASMRLVDRGKALIDGDEFERAASAFRDAINMDATNGVAYYYLALTYNYTDQPVLASGLLDKAEQLLGYDEDWKKIIDELRAELGEPSPPAYSNDDSEEGVF